MLPAIDLAIYGSFSLYVTMSSQLEPGTKVLITHGSNAEWRIIAKPGQSEQEVAEHIARSPVYTDKDIVWLINEKSGSPLTWIYRSQVFTEQECEAVIEGWDY